MKKIFKILFLVLIVILLIVIINVPKKEDISMNEVIEKINPQITSNMSLKINTQSLNKSITEEYYVKDNIAYKTFSIDNKKIQDFIFNYKTNEQINIFYDSKEILFYTIENSSNIISTTLNYYKTLISKSIENSYKNYEKETIDDKEFLKFSVNFEAKYFIGIDYPQKALFYVNIESGSIEKIEYYNIANNKEELVSTTEFIYSYNTVTDENLLNFDKNNYADYSSNKKDF